jgi:hypothetical protein
MSYLEVPVEAENLAGAQLLCQSNEARIREVNRQIAVFPKQPAHWSRRAGKLERNLNQASLHIRQNRLRSARQVAKQPRK